MQRYYHVQHDIDYDECDFQDDATGDWVRYSDALLLEKRVKELEAALGLKDADIDALRRRVSEMKREARKLLEAPREP